MKYALDSKLQILKFGRKMFEFCEEIRIGIYLETSIHYFYAQTFQYTTPVP